MTINALNIIPGKTDGCPRMGDLAIAKKMNVKWGKHKKGDIVLFDFNHNGTSDHIGILESINKDGTITTIEGNTGSGNDTNGGQVQRRVRKKKDVNYFVRPKYNSIVTVDMVLATARAELGVKESPKNSNKVKYNVWFYGKNISAFWCCTFICWLFAHVKEPEEIPVVTKPIDKYTGAIPSGLLKLNSKGEEVKKLQKFLNWYHPAWNLKVDGVFGALTEKAVKSFQKTEGITPDGEYGSISKSKANAYKLKSTKTSTTKSSVSATPNADKLIAKMDELAWAYGTAKKKYAYGTGAPKAVCKAAMAKFGYDTKAEQSDCGNFVNTVVRSSGVDKSFTSLHAVKTDFPKSEAMFDIVFSGKAIPSGLLKRADLIRYKKKSGQHAMFYYGDGKVCDAGHYDRFGNIRKDEKRYGRDNVKKSTIQVLRVKEY